MKKIIIIIFCIFSSCITAFAFQNTPGGWYNGGWGNGGWINGGWYSSGGGGGANKLLLMSGGKILLMNGGNILLMN